MKSMTWKGENNFTLDEVDIPQVAQGTCLVKIDTAGVCGTDIHICLLYTSPSPRDLSTSRMPSSA